MITLIAILVYGLFTLALGYQAGMVKGRYFSDKSKDEMEY